MQLALITKAPRRRLSPLAAAGLGLVLFGCGTVAGSVWDGVGATSLPLSAAAGIAQDRSQAENRRRSATHQVGRTAFEAIEVLCRLAESEPGSAVGQDARRLLEHIDRRHQ